MKKAVSLVMVVVIAVFTLALAGCGGSNDLIGRWKDASGSYMEFKADGTCSITNQPDGVIYKWTRSGDKVTINVGAEGTEFSIPIEMTIKSINGNTMVVEMYGAEQTLTKS